MLSQREAAATWGIGRTTIQRAVKSGRLSLTHTGTIDPSEMVRVFGEPAGHHGPAHGPPKTAGKPPVGHHGPWPAIPPDATLGRGVGHPETAQLQAKIEHLKAMLSEKDARIEDLRSAMRLLTDQRPPTKSLWARLTQK